MKFAVRAYVVVVDPTGKIGEATAKQMIGRSSRNFDTQTGFVLTKCLVKSILPNILTTLKNQDK